MTTHDITDFTIVDRTADPGFYQHFLDAANELDSIRETKSFIRDELRLSPGQRMLDAGCGLGYDVLALAERVGPSGSVVAVDVSELMIAGARKRNPSDPRVSFQVADVRELPFEEGSFDAACADRLLMHVPEAPRAVAELARVVRPGGRVSAFEFDWETLMIDSPHRDVTRAVVRSFVDHTKNGWMGRQLPRLFGASGFVDVSVSTRVLQPPFPFFELIIGGHLARMAASGVVSRAELNAWSADLAEANAAGRFFAGFTAFVVTGTRGPRAAK